MPRRRRPARHAAAAGPPSRRAAAAAAAAGAAAAPQDAPARVRAQRRARAHHQEGRATRYHATCGPTKAFSFCFPG